jgi:hypothetical protein
MSDPGGVRRGVCVVHRYVDVIEKVNPVRDRETGIRRGERVAFCLPTMEEISPVRPE